MLWASCVWNTAWSGGEDLASGNLCSSVNKNLQVCVPGPGCLQSHVHIFSEQSTDTRLRPCSIVKVLKGIWGDLIQNLIQEWINVCSVSQNWRQEPLQLIKVTQISESFHPKIILAVGSRWNEQALNEIKFSQVSSDLWATKQASIGRLVSTSWALV